MGQALIGSLSRISPEQLHNIHMEEWVLHDGIHHK